MNYVTRHEMVHLWSMLEGLNEYFKNPNIDPESMVTFDLTATDINGSLLGRIKFVDDDAPGYVFIPEAV